MKYQMENRNLLFKKIVVCFLAIILLAVIYSPESKAQNVGLNEAIAKNRKGEIVVQAIRGSQVTVEQMSHEFWFGCTIPNNLAGGMSPNNLKQFKEKFLENFNSAAT